MDRHVLKSIADKHGVKHLGYYVTLHLFGPFNPSKMADRCRISQGQCRKIEQDLVAMGLLQVSGVGRGRVVKIVRFDATIDKDAKELLVEFAARTGKDLGISGAWFQRQYKIAQDLVERYGYDACLFMLNHVIARGTDIYSLNFLDAVSGELIPKFERYREIKNRGNKLEQNMWGNLPTVDDVSVREKVTDDDIVQMLDVFDIDF